MKHATYTLLLLFVFASCGSEKQTSSEKSTSDNSRNAVDWDGTYTGKLPCADCAGIKTVIQLASDQTYTMRTRYEGKSDTTFMQQGTFSWNKEGSQIQLDDLAGSHPAQYLVGENILFQLDQAGNRITGDLAELYQLQKTSATLIDTYWKLQEIDGQAIDLSATAGRGAFLKMDGSTMRFSGNGGCNNLIGTYELAGENSITFSDAASTRMACPDDSIENKFTKALSATTNYLLNNNLQLLDKHQNVLAVFQADLLESVD
ncbi:MAG: copper resistance protein NlpE N-terminal domain-containing protein [Cyclobacteriaceae bacterium]